MNIWKSSHSHNREPAVAGSFYPGTKESLTNELEGFFNTFSSTKQNTQQPRALISPHAGYTFSGSVAASAFAQIPANMSYKRVFILASSHRYHFNGASIYEKGNYETPLGEVKVDMELAKKISAGSSVFTEHTEAHLYEHSLEVQLPFLQYRLGNSFQILPIIIGTDSPDKCRELAEALLPYFTKENLFVISSDFSHYPGYDDAIEADKLTADAICSNKPDKLLGILEHNKKQNIPNLVTSLCGWTSVLTLLHMTKSKDVRYDLIEYKNSGDNRIYGDKSKVVGYWGIGIFEKQSIQISENDQQMILKLAKNSINKFLGLPSEKIKLPEDPDHILNRKTGVFISVYVKEELRGCIGGFARNKSLKAMIKEMSVSAACDRRFDRVQAGDMEQLKLEISVLSPLEKISGIDEIELGRHGIYIRSGIYSGTLLPQVAIKTGWSKEEFLGKCSENKAGLGWNGWKQAELFTYEAFIIEES